MLEVDWLGEGELDAQTAARQVSWLERVRGHGVLGEVELEGATHALERLGAVGRALEVAVGFHQGTQAASDGVFLSAAILVEAQAGNLEATSERSAGVQVNGLGLDLPVLERLEVSAARAGTEVRHEGRVDNGGEWRTSGWHGLGLSWLVGGGQK